MPLEKLSGGGHVAERSLKPREAADCWRRFDFIMMKLALLAPASPVE